MSYYKPAGKVKYTHCRYCGARLKRDFIGQKCPTPNCQWQHGLSDEEDTPTKHSKQSGHIAGFRLLRGKMKPGQCPECAVVHKPEMPHNQQSLFWNYNFFEQHGRWPTWADAMAHCTPEMQQHWIRELEKYDIKVDLTNAIACPPPAEPADPS